MIKDITVISHLGLNLIAGTLSHDSNRPTLIGSLLDPLLILKITIFAGTIEGSESEVEHVSRYRVKMQI